MFKGKKYITFDCYGTLIDWEGGIRKALERLSEKNRFNLDLTNISDKYIQAELEVEAEQYRKYHEVLQLSAKKLLNQMGFDISDKDALEFADSIYNWQPFPETHDVLAELKQKGYKLIILSNIDNEIIKRSIELIGIDFDGVVTAEEVGSYKPAHGHWQEMLKRFNAQKEEVLHVAASYIHDIIPAKEQGFDAIWINRNSEQPTREIKPDLKFKDLRPLPENLF
ncbi:MAG: haloacid dehalogenase type II [Candidatus Levybacteria bacterium]|nr:haloacid dehalogenase type II [Candidatus Levybacteria bacterium]